MQMNARFLLVSLGVFMVFGCAGLKPPVDMRAYQNQTKDNVLKNRAMRMDPDLMKEAEKDYTKALEACDDNEQEMCDHYSTLAKIKLETVLERIAIDDAKKQQATKHAAIDVAQRTLEAEKIRKEAYDDRVKSNKKIEQLETKLVATSDKAEKERKERESVENEFSKQKGKLDVLAERDALTGDAAKIVGMDSVKQTHNSLVVTVRGLFKNQKIEIENDYTYVCESIAKLILKYPRFSIMIEGHTDSNGPDSANLAKSQARAQSLLDFFVKHDVPIDRMTATGKGESSPMSDNRTAKGKELNRRVEIKFLYPREE